VATVPSDAAPLWPCAGCWDQSTAYHFVADISFDTHFDRLGRAVVVGGVIIERLLLAQIVSKRKIISSKEKSSCQNGRYAIFSTSAMGSLPANFCQNCVFPQVRPYAALQLLLGFTLHDRSVTPYLATQPNQVFSPNAASISA
jgi:hypothetical protein